MRNLSKWQWAATTLGIMLLLSRCGYLESKEKIAAWVKESMQNEMKNDDAYKGLNIGEVVLVRESANKFTGYVEFKYGTDSEKAILTVTVDENQKIYRIEPPRALILKRSLGQLGNLLAPEPKTEVTADPSPLSDRGFDYVELSAITRILYSNPCRGKLECTSDGYEFTTVNLNDDAQPEFNVRLTGGCGSGGCQEILFALMDGKWRALAKVELGGIKVKKSKTGEMRDITLFDHKELEGNRFSHRFRHFVWDGSKYNLVTATREAD